MKIVCNEQRTQEWFDARRGCITASMAHVALMGKGTKGRRLYVEQLADDLEGLPDFADKDDPPWFAHGRYYESFARGWYSFRYDVDIRDIGFAVHDDYSWIGCSPDGLIETDYRDDGPGGCEFKCRAKLSTFVKHAATLMPGYLPQAQASMFICDRGWWDYVQYFRAEEVDAERGHVQRIYRDQSYIDNTLLPAFVTLWDDVQRECERRELQRRTGVG